MKLELIKKWKTSDIDMTFMFGNVVLPDGTLIVLSSSKLNRSYSLLGIINKSIK